MMYLLNRYTDREGKIVIGSLVGNGTGHSNIEVLARVRDSGVEDSGAKD